MVQRQRGVKKATKKTLAPKLVTRNRVSAHVPKRLKDIFVDDCVAARLENPMDPRLRGFLQWLESEGALVLSQKIIAEYKGSLAGRGSSTFIALLSKLQRDGRQFFADNETLKQFGIPRRIERSLRSNRKDWWHIRAVLLSPRKLAISFDRNFVRDLNDYPGVGARASHRVTDLPFR